MKAVYGIDEVAERYAVSTKTIRRWVRKGIFPKPNPLGAKKCWLMRSLDRFDEGMAHQTLMEMEAK